VVVALEVEPKQRESTHRPAAQIGNTQILAECWRANTSIEFELVKRGVGGPNKTHSDLGPSFLAVVPDFDLAIRFGLRAKNCRLYPQGMQRAEDRHTVWTQQIRAGTVALPPQAALL
jgi:hypothetical protein